MGISNGQLRRYLSEVRKLLPCSRSAKKRIMEEIEATITSYLLENSNVTYDDMIARFGAPQQIAATYVEEMGTDELLRNLKIRKKVIRITAIALLSCVIIWIGGILVALYNSYNSVNGQSYIYVEELD